MHAAIIAKLLGWVEVGEDVTDADKICKYKKYKSASSEESCEASTE